ncbi:MAG: GntR family transcriptional regulator [Ancrocorticia sp.]|nr:GntR family transcriptional regulator [Ancrocorticia sp.]MCI1963728.1 GntR family transcriptional regulator [Ancrocorticia sp.]MCI2002066.1 GntR family transcriptional regulator [Ancrocorticia sp.]MCI2012003.1 GntR family transcriptional regulator [Ancrocorticia sp.]MCI2029477.1 GntR family transcriptional regulator [Ancrocorticia sp.]
MVTRSTSDGYTQSERVARDLSEQILKGELKAGDQLASEQQLAEEYGASRGTIRRALAILKDSDMVRTRPGAGSFVAFHGASLAGTEGWTVATRVAGHPTTTEILESTIIPTPESLTDYCLMPEVYRIARRRFLAEEPISLEVSMIPVNDRIKTIMEFGLLGGSVSKTLRATGMNVTHGFQDISSEAVDDQRAELLSIPAGERVLVSRRIGFDESDEFSEFVESWLNPEHFTFHLSFKE